MTKFGQGTLSNSEECVGQGGLGHRQLAGPPLLPSVSLGAARDLGWTSAPESMEPGAARRVVFSAVPGQGSVCPVHSPLYTAKDFSAPFCKVTHGKRRGQDGNSRRKRRKRAHHPVPWRPQLVRRDSAPAPCAEARGLKLGQEPPSRVLMCYDVSASLLETALFLPCFPSTLGLPQGRHCIQKSLT